MSTPLVLLHGFLGCGQDWRPLMQDLARDRSCIAIELPGHGSKPSRVHPDFDTTVNWLAEGIETTIAERCDVLGYSMGGRLALGLAAACPGLLRRVVAVGAGAGIGDPVARAARAAQDDDRAAALEAEPFEAWLGAWYGLPLLAGVRALPAYEAMIGRRLQGDPKALSSALRALSVGRQPPLGPQLAAGRVPLLLMAGSEDAKYVASHRELAATSPLIEAVTVQDAGHAPHLEQPDEFRRAVREWLDRP